MRILFILLSLCCYCVTHAETLPSKKYDYLLVKAQNGDGVYSLLRSYHLLDDPRNISQFYKLNKLAKNQELIIGKTYKLPILIYSYDGKTIRSSTGINDYQTAKAIDRYNAYLCSTGLKENSYKIDQKIYVPKELKMLSVSFKDDLILDEVKAQFVSYKKSSSNTKRTSLSNKTKTDPRKQYLIGSMAPSKVKAMLVGERKLSDKELKELMSRTEEIASPLGSNTSKKKLNIPLFGSKYKNVLIENNTLKNQVFYIVPGHGGPDPGAIAKNVDGKYTICEDEYAYDVSLRLAKNLLEKGAEVYVIVQDENDGIRDEIYLNCDCDETSIGGHKIPVNQKKRLKQGINKVNKLYTKHKKKGITKQWMVSLHIDAQSEENRQDVFFYYQSDSPESKNKAIDIQKVFDEKYQTYRKSKEYSGTVTARPLYVVRNSKPEPIFIELANIHNEQDRKRILYSKNRQLLADWITDGFLK